MKPVRPALGLWQGVALYVGAGLGTGVLVLPGLAAEAAGPASVLAWLVLMLLSIPLASTYAALSRQRPDAAGFSDAIERAFGPRWGGVAGWLFLAQVPTGTVIVALIAGEYATSAVGGSRDLALALGAGLVLLAYALNAVGLRVSAHAQSLTLALLMAGLVLIIGRALPHLEPSAFSPLFPHGGTAVGLAAVQLFWAFVGWEAITPLAEEFRNPADIRRASLLAVATVGILYVSLAAVTVGTRAYGASRSAETSLVYLAASAFGPSAAFLVGVAAVLLSFAPLNAYVAGTSRLAGALGRRGQLPRWLGVVSPSGTPRRALGALWILSMLAAVVVRMSGLGIAELLPISTSSFIATYVLSMAAAVRLLRPPERYAALAALAACLVVLAFTGPLLAWIAAVAVCALAYQRIVPLLSQRGSALSLPEASPGLFIFARFHACPGSEGAMAEALLDVLAPSREEPGCLSIHAFRSIRDRQLFYIHSRWKDEAAFEYHAGLAHTLRFLERVEPLIDHPLDVTPAGRIG